MKKINIFNKNKGMKACMAFALLASVLSLSSCKNDDQDFPDFDYSTVYFARQYPIRTVVLGNDENADNTLDRNHQIEIYAVMGGKRSNGNGTAVSIEVDNSLCNNLYFENGTDPVKPMPAAYYQLMDNKIKFNGLTGCVRVQLTDAYFNDPASVNTTYVIPLRMKDVVGADSILEGKDYILYCVRYINPWSGVYLRRGVDVAGGQTTYRHKAHVEEDEVFTVTTSGFNTVTYPYASDTNLQLTFAADGSCTVASATSGVQASGTGHFAEKSEVKAWGNKDRDAIYLDYTVTRGGVTTATRDTLVARDRGFKVLNTFTPVVK